MQQVLQYKWFKLATHDLPCTLTWDVVDLSVVLDSYKRSYVVNHWLMTPTAGWTQ
jgi:hypothetical protein